jgi:hypothetical protein
MASRPEDLLSTYGADPRRWPGAERAEMERAATQAPQLMRSEAALDTALALNEARLDVDAFTAEAMARFETPTANVVALKPRQRLSGPVLALAACMMVGVIAGFGMGQSAPTDAADQALTAAFENILYTDEANDG